MKRALISILYGIGGAVLALAGCVAYFLLLSLSARLWGGLAPLAVGAATAFGVLAAHIAAKHYIRTSGGGKVKR